MFEEKVFDTIYVTIYDKVEGDERCLYERLILLNQKRNFKNYRLAKHLLLKIKDFHCIEDGKLNDLKLSSNIKSIDFIHLIGKGYYRGVYKSKLFGLLYATKKINKIYVKSFIKEVSILVNLSHCNLISYYFVMKSTKNEYKRCYSSKMTNDYVYLEMELIQINLKDMLKINGKASYIFIINTMYQIARRMYYLHNMHISHCDLKHDNI